MRFLPVSETECERIAFILKLQPMFIVNSYALAVLFCFITMMCWGSWGNTQKLASKSWRYELFYWDYVIGMVLFKPRTWCVFCPMGTMTQLICRLRVGKHTEEGEKVHGGEGKAGGGAFEAAGQ